jgi:hypothetical protein
MYAPRSKERTVRQAHSREPVNKSRNLPVLLHTEFFGTFTIYLHT